MSCGEKLCLAAFVLASHLTGEASMLVNPNHEVMEQLSAITNQVSFDEYSSMRLSTEKIMVGKWVFQRVSMYEVTDCVISDFAVYGASGTNEASVTLIDSTQKGKAFKVAIGMLCDVSLPLEIALAGTHIETNYVGEVCIVKSKVSDNGAARYSSVQFFRRGKAVCLFTTGSNVDLLEIAKSFDGLILKSVKRCNQNSQTNKCVGPHGILATKDIHGS